MSVANKEQFTGNVDFKVGSMIEIPRACITAEEFAPHCDFLSFGTNDLTQFSLGISRDDSASFLEMFVEKGIYE
jgi:pyruvate,orthophosphate dikinase